MILYSRLPLAAPVVEYIVDDTIPSIHAGVILRTGETIALHCVHPRPPVPGNDTEERDAELVIVGRRVKEGQRPAIVIGDFNDVAWSETTELFQELSGTLDPRIGRGTYNTFNANYFFLRFPLDHIFHTDHFRLVRLETLDDINSDHFPMFAELSYEPERRHEQSEPEAEESDHEEAQEKLKETERKK
jgi:endonuclease/exonuclease/phosphatase (EEP) superfamily protein YafD